MNLHGVWLRVHWTQTKQKKNKFRGILTRSVFKSVGWQINLNIYEHSKQTDIKWTKIGKRICGCMSTEHGDNELELGPDDILVDGLIKKSIKNQGELEVAIGDGMEFTIHGDLKSKNKKAKTVLSSMRVCG